MKVGLRFERKDAQLLRQLGHRVELGETPGYKAAFDQAAEAAETGEPLQLECADLDEAKQLAHDYSTLGCSLPVVEELSPA